jgi:hypothetical protein
MKLAAETATAANSFESPRLIERVTPRQQLPWTYVIAVDICTNLRRFADIFSAR